MLSRESLIEWAAHWVPADTRQRFTEALTSELADWTPSRVGPTSLPYPPGMREESRRLHSEYKALIQAQSVGAQNSAEVIRLTDECARKGIILVPGGEHL